MQKALFSTAFLRIMLLFFIFFNFMTLQIINRLFRNFSLFSSIFTNSILPNEELDYKCIYMYIWFYVDFKVSNSIKYIQNFRIRETIELIKPLLCTQSTWVQSSVFHTISWAHHEWLLCAETAVCPEHYWKWPKIKTKQKNYQTKQC